MHFTDIVCTISFVYNYIYLLQKVEKLGERAVKRSQYITENELIKERNYSREEIENHFHQLFKQKTAIEKHIENIERELYEHKRKYISNVFK